jgi:hypothetical protein
MVGRVACYGAFARTAVKTRSSCSRGRQLLFATDLSARICGIESDADQRPLKARAHE